MNYNNIHALTVNAIKEIDSEVTILKRKVKELERIIENGSFTK